MMMPGPSMDDKALLFPYQMFSGNGILAEYDNPTNCSLLIIPLSVDIAYIPDLQGHPFFS